MLREKNKRKEKKYSSLEYNKVFDDRQGEEGVHHNIKRYLVHNRRLSELSLVLNGKENVLVLIFLYVDATRAWDGNKKE